MSKLVLKNTSINMVQFVFSAVLVFLMTPLYVRVLGDYDYGVWQIVAALLGYASFFDLGFQPTVSRFVARFTGRDQKSKLRVLVGTSVTIVTLLSLIPALGFAVWAIFGYGSLGEEVTPDIRYRWVLIIIAITLPIAFLNLIFTSVVEGIQAYTARTIINITGSLIFIIGFVTLHDRSDPLVLMAALNLIMALIKVAALGFFITSMARQPVQLLPLQFSVRLSRRLFRFGSKSFAQGVAGSVEGRMDTLIIGAAIGPGSVIFYSLPQVLTAYIKTVSETLSHAFLPALSNLREDSEVDAVRHLTMTGSQLVLAIVTPLAIGIICLGSGFLSLWIGPGYGEKATVLIPILSAYFFIPMLTPVVGRYFTALNEHGYLAVVASIRAAANLTLSLALLPFLGLIGIALGSLLPEMLSRLFVLHRQLKLLNMRLRDYLRELFLPILLPAVAMGVVIVTLQRWVQLHDWGGFFLVAGSGISIYILLMIPNMKRRYGLLTIHEEESLCITKRYNEDGTESASPECSVVTLRSAD